MLGPEKHTFSSRFRQILWWLRRRTGKNVMVKTQQGTYLLPTTTDDPISKSLYIYRNFEGEFVKRTIAFLQKNRFLSKGGTLLDVGANNGVTTISCLLSGEFNQAIALEPAPENLTLLQTNLALNHLETQVTTIPKAASDFSGEVQLELSKDNRGDHRVRKIEGSGLFGEETRATLKVPAETLDTILDNLGLSSPPSLVWVDVQGHEFQTFKGAQKLLSKGVPVVSEIWPYGLKRAGTTLTEFSALVAQTWTHYWVWRETEFIPYLTKDFPDLLTELGEDGWFNNVIFTNNAIFKAKRANQ